MSTEVAEEVGVNDAALQCVLPMAFDSQVELSLQLPLASER